MKTTAEKIAIMQAFEEGKTIQSTDVNGVWYDLDKPMWNWPWADYRVKPEEQFKRCFLVYIDTHNSEAGEVTATHVCTKVEKELADKYFAARDYITIIQPWTEY